MHNKCTINDKWTYNGMKVVFMENQFLKIGILVDRGSDIFHFEYKPKGINLMLKLDKDILNPNQIFSQMRDTTNQFEDYYYGGWQEILPNSAPGNYQGSSLGQHGEVSLIPWEYSILNNSPEEISIKLWTRPLRFPISIEKTLTLKSSSTKLFIEETLINESDVQLHLMWGHHIAFGLPFLSEGGTIKTSGSKFQAEALMPQNRIFKPGNVQDWPTVLSMDNHSINASQIFPSSENHKSDLAYLSSFIGEAFYSITTDVMSFSIHWDKEIFKSLWYWQERFATQGAPWWGKTYAIALEPWSSQWHPNPDKNVMENEWIKLEPREILKTKLHTDCHHDK